MNRTIKNEMKKKVASQKGFTMVELIIVVAIMGVIGTLLVPAFGPMVAKAKITSDLATVKTLKRTSDIYKTETGAWPTATTLDTLNTELKGAGYLEDDAILQTENAALDMSTAKTIKLDLRNVVNKQEVVDALEKMDDKTVEEWIDKPDATAAPTTSLEE